MEKQKNGNVPPGLYHAEIPAFLQPFLETPELRRLRDVGMNCGCEYTDFPRFRELAPYSRFDHSVGAALIVWHFTADTAAASAALFHDVATPVFAHVVDFLRGDYLRQEATEDGTAGLILGSAAIRETLRRHRIEAENTVDYHRYPIADNDSPRLSADRLEYTLGNLVNFRLANREAARRYYEDLTVSPNEDGVPELMFRTREPALTFARGALACSRIYVAREDRYALQMFAELLGRAIRDGVLSEADLMTTETDVIQKLTSQPGFERKWVRFRAYREITAQASPGPEEGWRQIRAKKRYIDPGVAGQGRISDLDPAFRQELRSFLTQSQEEWLLGV